MDLFIKFWWTKRSKMEIKTSSYNNVGITILSIILLLLLLPINARADLIIWCAGDSQKIQPYDKEETKNFFWDSQTKTVRLHGAKNEYIAFQIVINAAGEKLSQVNISTDDFLNKEASISKNNISLFRENYLKVTVPSSNDGIPVTDAKIGIYPTQMVPFQAKKMGAPFNIENDSNQPVWVDTYIPEDAIAGDYESYFIITAEGKQPQKIKVLLTVWNFVLPYETHFKTYIYYGSEQLRWNFGYSNSEDPTFRGLEDNFFQMAHQHRLVLCPNIEVDWGYDKFEEYWNQRGRGAYIDGSAYMRKGQKRAPSNTWVASINIGDDKNEYKRLAKVLVDFFKKKGLADILMLYVYDEPRSKETYEFIRERCQWVHEAVGKELPCMVTVPIKPPNASWGSLVGYVDIWNSGDSSLKDINERIKAGDRVWTYNMGWGGGPYVDTPGVSGRTQAWVGWKFGFQGWMFWDSCYWIDTNNLRNNNGNKVKFDEINSNPYKYRTDVWNDPMTFDQMRRPGYLERDAIRLNGDGVLFYPGEDVGLKLPISSFTMKSLRRGLQDYEYLWLLKNMGREEIARSIVDTLIPEPKKWNKDVNVWYAARIKLAEEILSASVQKDR